MQSRAMRRAVTAAVTIMIASSVAAFADTVPADGDAVTAGNQALVVLPDAMPGQVVTWPVDFRLTCSGTSHPVAGTTIGLELLSATVPLDGVATATATTIGPVPDGWPAAGESCPSPTPTVASDDPSTVTLTMPSTPGNGYEFSLMWSRSEATGLTGGSAVTFRVDVVGNTPPTLHLPDGVTRQATSPAGATASWTATATDDEDAVAPTPICDPASGSTFPLGSTTVHCSVTDDGGLTVRGSFVVTVDDTIAPKLVGLPDDRAVTTTDPTGTTLTYHPPSATDAADPDPVVHCLPASGSRIGLGKTTVMCTATDATGNRSTGSFDVVVTYADAVAWTARWGEPVANGGAPFVANPGRTVPVKVEILADGVGQRSGVAVLTVSDCAGNAVGGPLPMTWSGGRWNVSLDTATLGGPGCYVAEASLDGHVAGSFRIDLRGAEPASIGSPKAKPRK